MQIRVCWVIGLLACLSLISCGEKVNPEEQKAERVIRAPLGAKVKGFDPAFAGDTTSVSAQGQIFEPLYQYRFLAEEYELEPCLAEEMGEFSEDGLTYTVRIKKGVVFQDDPCFADTNGTGRELTVDDFIFAFKRLADVKVRSTGWWIFDGKIVGLDEFRETTMEAETGEDVDYSIDVEGLKPLDPHTLQIKLKKRYPQLPYVLAMPYAVPVAHEALESAARRELLEEARSALEEAFAPDHPLAGERQIKFRQLMKHDFLIREPGSGTRMAMEGIFQREGAAMNCLMELGSSEAIKQGVIAGLGLSILSRHCVWLELKTGYLTELDVINFPDLRVWNAVHLSGKVLSPVAESFLDFIVSNGQSIENEVSERYDPLQQRSAAP